MRPRRIIAALASFSAASALAVDVYLGAWGGVGTWSGSGADRYWAYGVPYEWNTNDFVLVWNVPDTNAVAIPCRSGYTYACRVFWGDGTSSEITAWNDADLTHIYAAAGTYVVAVTGVFPTIYFNNGGNKALVTKVLSLGNSFTSLNSSFYGCTGLTEVVGHIGTNVNDTAQAVRDCSRLYAIDVSAWDVSKVTSMFAMFLNCSKLTNLVVASWNPENALNLSSVFIGCNELTNGFITILPPKLTTAFNLYYSSTKVCGDVANVQNYAASNLYLGYQNGDAMTYSHAGGMLSSNIAHKFNFDMSGATLSSNEVTYILEDLDTSAATGGVVNVSGGANQKPTYDGYVAATNLTGKGWTVTLP